MLALYPAGVGSRLPDKQEARRLNVIGSDELAVMQLPPREFLLEPFLYAKTLSLLFGPRGIGKTFLSIGIALAVATGTAFLHWKATTPKRVLYIDGELPLETLQERIQVVARAMRIDPPANLRLLTPDMQGTVRIPNIAEAAGQQIIEQIIDEEDSEFVIFDNLSTLCRSGEENAPEPWQIIQDWLILLRSHRRACLLIHHSGKSGDQRGTSKREDVLDLSMKLTLPADYEPEQGARFQVEFTKSRLIRGVGAMPFEARLLDDRWSWETLSAQRDVRIIELDELGWSSRAIGKELGINFSTVSRTLRKLGKDSSK